MGNVTGTKVGRERGAQVPGIGTGVIDLDGEPVLDVHQVPDETYPADDNETRHGGGGGVDGEEGVNAGEVEWRGDAPDG